MPLVQAVHCWKKFSACFANCLPKDVTLVCLDRSGDGDAAGPCIFWELRRLLPLMSLSCTLTWSFLELQSLEEDAEKVGIDGIDFFSHMHLTTKFAKARGRETDSCAAEFECSTAFVVLICLPKSLHRDGRIQKSSQETLQFFLQAVADPSDLDAMIMDGLPHVDALPDEMPEELQPAHAELQDIRQRGLPHHESLARQVVALWWHAQCHMVLMKCAEDTIWKLSRAIDDRRIWENSWSNDYIKDGRDLVHQSKKKRARMDEGLQQALGDQVATRRAAPTNSAFLRVADVYSSDHGQRFVERYIRSTVAASWAQFENVEHLSFCSDGVRSGTPATENLIVPVWNITGNCSTWLPPMEFREGS
jgi:hypothetical protein